MKFYLVIGTIDDITGDTLCDTDEVKRFLEFLGYSLNPKSNYLTSLISTDTAPHSLQSSLDDIGRIVERFPMAEIVINLIPLADYAKR